MGTAPRLECGGGAIRRRQDGSRASGRVPVRARGRVPQRQLEREDRQPGGKRKRKRVGQRPSPFAF